MTEVSVRKSSDGTGSLCVSTPFNKEYIAGVKSLGGSWQGSTKEWVVPADVEGELTTLLKDVYGYGEDKVDMVITFDNSNCGLNEQSYNFYGRSILYRLNRDYSVAISDGVAILEGDINDFGESGGSHNYPLILGSQDIWTGKILVRGVPKSHFDKAVADNDSDSGVTYSVRENVEITNKYMDYGLSELVAMRKLIDEAITSKEANDDG
jgi:hypothetical protein